MRLVLLIGVLLLSSCSAVDTVQSWIPKPFDGTQLMMVTDLRVDLDRLQCGNARGWEGVIARADKLALYAEMRNEVQAENARSVHENIETAAQEPDDSPLCPAMLEVAKTRLEIIGNLWGTRR